MLSLDNTPLVGAARFLDATAVAGASSLWTWRRVHMAALELAARLDGVRAVVNLCSSRVGFLVTCVAALRRGCPQFLPPSDGSAGLVPVLASRRRCQVIVDDPQAMTGRWSGSADILVHVPRPGRATLPDARLAWAPAWDQPLVCLYTSGSTGRPQAHMRTLGQLARGAQATGSRLDQALQGGVRALGTIVSSVPPQHMFGLEMSVMLPLVHGLAVHEGRPLLPADVHAALAAYRAGATWIATPLHLRAFDRCGEHAPHCHAVIASTMPLQPRLAGRIEALLGAPVLEIYGSTETGAVAMRRTARDDPWQALAGVTLQPAEQGTWARGRHFPSPHRLGDRIEIDTQGGFRLVGRCADLVKIGGRRASLAGLNLLLQDLPGLAEGVFHLPAADTRQPRMVLIHEGPPLAPDSIHAWLRERVDPVFLPRAIIRVDRLPRTATGKLSRQALDRIAATWAARKTTHGRA